MHKQLPTYVIMAGAVAAVLVLAGVPLVTLLPLAMMPACPLMMILMMRGMSGMGGGHDQAGHGDGATRPGDRPERSRS